MSDIDFDELDRAVGNLMGKTQNRYDDSPAPPNPDHSSTEYNAADKSASEPHQEEQLITPDNKENELPKTPEKPVVVARPKPSTGRFMDVVHPSADMRSAATLTPQRPSRSAALSGLSLSRNGTNIPDDFAETEKLQTPFLPNANTKVQKRPLGAIQWPFSRESKEQTYQTNESIDGVANATGSAQNELSEQPLETTPINADFRHQEIKVSELDKNMDQPPIDPTHIETELTDQDRVLQSIESAPVEDTDMLPHDGASVRQVDSGDTEHLLDGNHDAEVKESDKSEETGTIYDVKNYHQPLHHPARHKSGWGTIVIVLAVIIIGIVLATAAFFVFGGSL